MFAAISAAFAIPAIMNFTAESGEPKAPETETGEFIMNAAAVADAPARELAGLISNDERRQKTYPEGIRDELKRAYAINGNLAGWLSIPGTELDTAVLQGEDNERYLKRDFYERITTETSNTNYGNIYLDYRCQKDALSKNTVIHGHTTGRLSGVYRQAFRSLYDYKNREHFINHPIIKYSTLKEEYKFKICAVFLSTVRKSADAGYVFNYIYPDMSDANAAGYIKQVEQRALYETGVSLEPADKIITLSTCIYDYGKNVDTRLVVVGRLLHAGESEKIDPSLVADRPDYRRPQIWYDARGRSNPYKNAEKWLPSAE